MRRKKAKRIVPSINLMVFWKKFVLLFISTTFIQDALHHPTTHTLSMAMRDVDEQRRHRGYGQQANLERDQSISIMTNMTANLGP